MRCDRTLRSAGRVGPRLAQAAFGNGHSGHNEVGSMKVLVIGASGAIGRAVTAEMLARGHTVTAATRSGAPVEGVVVQAVTGDASNPESVARLAAGQDAVASATGPRRANAHAPEGDLR